MKNHIKKYGEKKRKRHIKNPNQRSATTPVHINGSHTRDIHPCGATHMFHHSRRDATPINPLYYASRCVEKSNRQQSTKREKKKQNYEK